MIRPLVLRNRAQEGRAFGEDVVLIRRSGGFHDANGYWVEIGLNDEAKRIVRASTEPTTTVHRRQISHGGVRQNLEESGERYFGQRTFMFTEVIYPGRDNSTGDVVGHPYARGNEDNTLWYHIVRVEMWRSFWVGIAIMMEPKPRINILGL